MKIYVQSVYMKAGAIDNNALYIPPTRPWSAAQDQYLRFVELSGTLLTNIGIPLHSTTIARSFKKMIKKLVRFVFLLGFKQSRGITFKQYLYPLKAQRVFKYFTFL